MGLTPRQIAAQLSNPTRMISDQAASAAAVRGRREMAARRLDPQRLRSTPRAAAPTAVLTSAPTTRERPLEPIAQLLAWAEQADGYAPKVALQTRALLMELAALRRAAQAPKPQLPSAEPVRKLGHNRYTDRGAQLAYNSMVLAWAVSQQIPIAASGRVTNKLIAAYEAAHADGAQPQTSESVPSTSSTSSTTTATSLSAKDQADREAMQRAIAAAVGPPASGAA